MFKRKRNIYILVISVLLLVGLQSVLTVRANTSLEGKIIYLDAGHGGYDPGACYKNLYEKDINLEITLKLRDKLESMGATVYLTRDTDVDLANGAVRNKKRSDLYSRIRTINNSDCDLFLSIHLNSESSHMLYGFQTFYYKDKALGDAITKSASRLNKVRSNKKKEYYILKNAQKPGVIVELGYLSNASDRYLLQKDSYQQKLVEILCNGILDYVQL